jgi:lysozyme
MHINQAGLDLIKKFEGLRLRAYQDSVGVWTIGYGHTDGVWDGQRITEDEAEALLKSDLKLAEQGVTDMVTAPINENQFAALVSFAFNLGTNALRGSTLLRQLNMGFPKAAAEQFLRWDHAGGKLLLGLQLRRQAERALFLKGLADGEKGKSEGTSV